MTPGLATSFALCATPLYLGTWILVRTENNMLTAAVTISRWWVGFAIYPWGISTDQKVVNHSLVQTLYSRTNKAAWCVGAILIIHVTRLDMSRCLCYPLYELGLQCECVQQIPQQSRNSLNEPRECVRISYLLVSLLQMSSSSSVMIIFSSPSSLCCTHTSRVTAQCAVCGPFLPCGRGDRANI